MLALISDKVKLETRGTRFIDKYWKQKTHAKERGIEFNLTYDEWTDWWGVDIHNRGRCKGQLQMCRFGDAGSYELGNIYKDTVEENIRLSNQITIHRPKSLSSLDVEFIQIYLDSGHSTRKIAEVFEVSQRTIMRVKLNQGAY